MDELLDPYRIMAMAGEWAKFLAYYPEARKLAVAACALGIFAALLLISVGGFRLRDRARIRTLGLDRSAGDDIERIFRFAGGGELEIYGGACRITIGGVAVSGMLRDILSIRYDEAENRTFTIIYAPDEGYRLESVRCGRMADSECAALRDIMLRYAGG